jgi:hypothetical protein
MARTIADITADIQRLERMIQEHNIKRSPLANIVYEELIELQNTREERREKRAERRAERHAEIDTDETTLATIQAETDMSQYLLNKVDQWDEKLARERTEIDR